MIRQLEKWAWYGGALLACSAGMVNAIGLESFLHEPITHVTGATTLFAVAVAHGDLEAIRHAGLVLGSFGSGAVLGGFVVESGALKLGRRYGVALIGESGLLFLATMLIRQHHPAGIYFAACACGVQNALASTYSGAILRTTHVTGLFSDFGAALGQALRGAPVDWLRAALCAMLIGSFTLGGVLGGLLFARYSVNTLFFPAGLTGVLAVVYALYVHRRQKAPGREDAG